MDSEKQSEQSRKQLMRAIDLKELSRTQLEIALEKLVGLQAHYAKLLNMHDGGERISFKSAEEWCNRLIELDDL